MLCQFTFKNYKSYRDETILDMQAVSSQGFEHSLLPDGNKQELLPVAAIYGPNAGGKSNVLDALKCLHSLVVFPILLFRGQTTAQAVNCVPFLFDEKTPEEPTEFETLVVKLLLKMGYGYGIEDAGMVTRATGDGGIDGIIKEDQLGFNNIYIQAKKWSADHKVSRPEVQKFAGALQGEKATKGLFITTTEFTKDAQDFAANLLGSNIVLIDGNQLTKLMIKYNLGVAVEQTFEVKRIDSDFFSEDL